MLKHKPLIKAFCILQVYCLLFSQLAYAASCDTTNFEQFFQYQGKTYALAKQPSTFAVAQQTVAATGGNLVVITDANQNSVLANQLVPYFTQSPAGVSEAWIGLMDPNNTQSYCTEDQTTPCTPQPQRFSWVTGAASTFANWSTNQPDNYCSRAERLTSPTFSCYGENWGTMLANGRWNDDGDHGPTPLQLKGIAQWPAILDCVVNSAPPLPPTGVTLPTEAGLWCTSADNSSMMQCLATTDGNSICPADKVACNAVLDQPICNGSTLNTTRHMCQSDPAVTCPAGSTPFGVNCQQDFTKSCPAGYSLSADQTQCVARPVCDQGVYNDVTNKCEVPTQSTTGYAQPTVGVTQIVKYEPRGHTATGISDYSTTSTGITEVVRFTFVLSNGQVQLQDECAWGGYGNCGGCDKPAWQNPDGRFACWAATDIQTSTSSTTLKATATMYDDGPLVGCPIGYSYAGGPCDENGNCEPGSCYPNPYTTTFGATAMADLSEFLTCPAGYTMSPPLTADQCTTILSLWGRNTGVQDCTNPGKYSCTASITACANGQTLSPSGDCIINAVNPYCPTGNSTVTLDNTGLTNDQCLTPYIKVCPDSMPYDPSTGKCTGGAQITCSQGSFTGAPVNQCESVPICANGFFIADVNACYNKQNTCPLGNYSCYQIQGDPTQSIPGIPMTYCSPDQCVNNTNAMMTGSDTAAGTNDIKNDGTITAGGACQGSIYIFNGADKRCVEEDKRTMIASITKTIAAIAAAALGNPELALLTTMGGQVAGDAISGQLGTGTLMAVGLAAITYGFKQYGDLMNKFTSQLTDSWNKMVSTIQSNIGYYDPNATSLGSGLPQLTSGWAQPAANLTLQPMSSYDQFVQQVYSKLSAATGLDPSTLQTMAHGAVAGFESSMFSSYGPMKCCYPDKLSPNCQQSDIQEANMAANGQCHIIGDYCAVDWLGLCVVTKQTSCCFNSQLGRLIVEQGRPQLQAFSSLANNGWGDVETPECRGFHPEEFQYIDMSKVDFSEYIKSVQMNQAPLIQQMTLQGAQTYIQNSQSATVPTAPTPTTLYH